MADKVEEPKNEQIINTEAAKAKAAEVAGRYFNYRLKKEDCKKLSAPPKTNKNKVYGPFYEDNKIWLVMDDDTIFKDIAVVDYAENNDDGTMTLYFTIYCIDHELVQKMMSDNPVISAR